jgi:hypothetical protein
MEIKYTAYIGEGAMNRFLRALSWCRIRIYSVCVPIAIAIAMFCFLEVVTYGWLPADTQENQLGISWL